MRQIALLVAKDLKRSLRDRSALAVTIGAPLLLATILSLLLGSNGDAQKFKTTFAVVDQDRGPVAAGFVDGVLGGMQKAGFVEVRRVGSPDEARRLAADGKVSAAFVLPAGLSQAAQSGPLQQSGQAGAGDAPGVAAEIEVVTDPESEIGAQIARTAAEGYVAEIRATAVAVGAATSASRDAAGSQGPQAAPDPATIQALVGRASHLPQAMAVRERAAGSKQFTGNTFMAAGMTVFFLFFTAQFGAVSILRERREGTLPRLLASPVPRRAILASKALYAYVLGAGSMAVLVAATTLLIGAHWGKAVPVAALIAAGAFAALGVQSLGTTLADNDEQAAGLGALVGVVLGLLGGTLFPLTQGGDLVNTLSKLTPHFWMMRGFAETSGGNGLATVAPSLAVLLLYGLVSGSIALVRTRAKVAAR